MADHRISDLPAATAVQRLDLVEIEHCSSGTDRTTPANNTYVSSYAYAEDFAVSMLPSTENWLINPDMQFDQQFEGGVSTFTVASGFPVDGWFLAQNAAGGTLTAQRSTDAPIGYSNSLLITTTANATPGSSNGVLLRAAVEGCNLTGLNLGTANAASVVLTLWLKSSLTGNFSGSLQSGNAGRAYVMQFNIAAANTWQRFVFIIPGETGGGTWSTATGSAGMFLNIDLGSGSARGTASPLTWLTAGFTFVTGSNTLIGNNGATLQVAGVRLRKGVMDTGYVRRPYSQEYEMVRRFYRKTFPEGTAVAQNAGLAGALTKQNPIALGQPDIYWQFSPPMAASPTVTTYNPSVANANWRDVTTSADIVVSLDPAGTKGKTGVHIATGATVAALANQLAIHATADCRI